MGATAIAVILHHLSRGRQKIKIRKCRQETSGDIIKDLNLNLRNNPKTRLDRNQTLRGVCEN